jgi:hypothetical protein
MMRLAGALTISILAVGCGVGDPNDTGPDMNPLGRQCTTTFSTHGSFVPDTANPKPVDPETGVAAEGCWPIGVWTFQATIDTNDCAPAPTLLAQYQFKGTVTLNEDGDPIQAFEYMTDSSVRNIVKVSEGGSGLCEGEVDLYNTDGTQVFLFKPALNADNSIAGDGEFGVFDSNQWPY